MVKHVADNVGVVEALGEQRAVIVGHDWGAPIAWSSCLLRPDVFDALVLLSVPYAPRSSTRPMDAFRAMAGDEEFYIEYFQEPGRAEAEIEADVRSWLSGFYYSASGDAPPRSDGRTMATVARGGLLRERFSLPDGPLPWLSEEDLDFYVAEFERTGLTGGLNRYRNMDRDWEELPQLAEATIKQPALFIAGEYDGVIAMSKPEAMQPFVPDLRKSVILPKAGHWTQQERAREVNEELIAFLNAL